MQFPYYYTKDKEGSHISTPDAGARQLLELVHVLRDAGVPWVRTRAGTYRLDQFLAAVPRTLSGGRDDVAQRSDRVVDQDEAAVGARQGQACLHRSLDPTQKRALSAR